MDEQVWLVRHGETEWSRDGRHTSVTDLELTDRGERQGAALRERLRGQRFDRVVSSPLGRARRTAVLAGYAAEDVEIDDDLHEWRYGDYEGITTPQIRETVPGWTVWTHPVPGGDAEIEQPRRKGVGELVNLARGQLPVEVADEHGVRGGRHRGGEHLQRAVELRFDVVRLPIGISAQPGSVIVSAHSRPPVARRPSCTRAAGLDSLPGTPQGPCHRGCPERADGEPDP